MGNLPRRRVRRVFSGTAVTIERYENRRPNSARGTGNNKDQAMSKVASFGFWTCATVYTAIGVIGILFLSTQPNVASPTDGYGTIRLVAQK